MRWEQRMLLAVWGDQEVAHVAAEGARLHCCCLSSAARPAAAYDHVDKDKCLGQAWLGGMAFKARAAAL